MFKSIQINKWRQFGDVDITFHDRLTILTGTNGSGKTTILNIFNSHFGWQTQFVGTPKQSLITNVFKFFSDVWRSIFDIEKVGVRTDPPESKALFPIHVTCIHCLAF